MITRRTFQSTFGAAVAASVMGGPAQAKSYTGPNIVLIRFGGGVRRQETITDPTNTYAPYTRRVLAKRGVLIPNLMIDQINGGNTSHAEGTLNLLTGRYNAYRDAGSKFLQDRLEPTEPTLFEYLRSAYEIPSHQALLINGEDRPQEEFFTFGPEGHYGIDFRSEMLSLHRFKLYKFARILEDADRPEKELQAAQKAYHELMAADARPFSPEQSLPIQEFWARWRDHYGEDGFRNPRGDRLLTELALWAIRDLKPRLMMINYQDTDYVHWGNASHYTRAIQVIDDGIRQVMNALDTDEHYRDNSVVVVTPDCGRDANPLMSVPFQHHFNSRGAHEVWALIVGAGVAKDRIYDRQVDQTAMAATLAEVMGVRAKRAEGDVLSGLFI
ncbi:MAG: sulfatase-like hydrolase/transferase [Silicimonas sp.]|nr:sulfatase-like hydrolase/transferase [Silicimonas sp.]